MIVTAADHSPVALHAKNQAGEWGIVDANPHPEVVMPSIFTEGHYLGEGTVWTRDARTMPLAENSDAMAAWMWENMIDPWGRTGDGKYKATGTANLKGTSLNRSNHRTSTAPIALYVVNSRHPACRFVDFQSRGGFPPMPAEERAAVEKHIPWPSFARPAINGDRGMAIWDVGTGIMREFFMVEKSPIGQWGGEMGYSVASPGLKNLASENYGTQLFAGSSAVARMHNNLGFIGISEVRAGVINHALAFTFGAVAKGNPPSWPASGTDGKAPVSEKDSSPVHGQWGRVKASVDPMLNPRTGLPFNPLTRMLIRAAQRYGLVGTDTNAFVHAFNVEDGTTEAAFFGEDPWVSADGLAAHIENEYRVPAAGAFDVSDFPWDQTEWAPRDWGRPDVDFIRGSAVANTWRRDMTEQGLMSQ